MITIRKIDLSTQLLLLLVAVITLLLSKNLFLICLLIFWGVQLTSALLNTAGFLNIQFGSAIRNYWLLSIIDLLVISAWIYLIKSGYELPVLMIALLVCCRMLIGLYYCFIYNEFIGRLVWRREVAAFTRSKR